MSVKIVLFLALVALANCQLGGLNPDQVSQATWEMAKWSTSQMSQYTGLQGEHAVKNIRDVTTQLVAGTIYRFTLDINVIEPTGTLSFSCRIAVFDQPWTQTREFLSYELPKCVKH